MKISSLKLLLFFLLFFSFDLIAVQPKFKFKRKIKGVHKEWHQLLIPIDLYAASKQDFSDLRIQGYTKAGDTLNVPYIFEDFQDVKVEKSINFKIINESYRNDWYYFTLVCPSGALVNNLELNFAEKNFDWHVNLDAAEKLGEWVTVLDDVRIMSFDNGETSYLFSKLKFSDSKFPYYRVSIHGTKKPTLKSVKLNYFESLPGNLISYPVRSFKATNNSELKESILEFSLDRALPVKSMLLFSKTHSDYFRKIIIEYSNDSVNSDSKWEQLFQPIVLAYISSDDYEPIDFETVKAKNFRIRVYNDDNDPVKFENIQLFGPQHKLILRFNDIDADYFLYYGNESLSFPVFDIENFTSKIPKDLEKLFLGPEILGDFAFEQPVQDLFQKKIWLWSVLISLFLLLAFFTFRMLKQEKE
jgi:hypothetical protein